MPDSDPAKILNPTGYRSKRLHTAVLLDENKKKKVTKPPYLDDFNYDTSLRSGTVSAKKEFSTFNISESSTVYSLSQELLNNRDNIFI